MKRRCSAISATAFLIFAQYSNVQAASRPTDPKTILWHSVVVDSTSTAQLTVDEKGDIFTLESAFHRIAHFSPDGRFLNQLGTIGQGVGEFYYPDDMVLGKDGKFYVLESLDRRVQAIDKANKTAVSFSIPHAANSLAVNTKSQILIADPYSGRLVSSYDQKGKLLFSFGDQVSFSDVYGSKHMSLDRQYQHAINRVLITVDDNDNVYVAFIGVPILRKYSSSGALLHEWRYANAEDIKASIGNTLTVGSSEKFIADGVPIPSLVTGLCFDRVRNQVWFSLNWKNSYLGSIGASSIGDATMTAFPDPHVRLGRMASQQNSDTLLVLVWGASRTTTLLYIQKPTINP